MTNCHRIGNMFLHRLKICKTNFSYFNRIYYYYYYYWQKLVQKLEKFFFAFKYHQATLGKQKSNYNSSTYDEALDNK